MTTKPNDSHLQAVAYLVEAITAGRWHRAGVMSALRECDGPLWLIAHAAIVCAHSRTDQTSPAVIAMIGPHWDDPTTKPKPDGKLPAPNLPAWHDDLADVIPADVETIHAQRRRLAEALAATDIPTREAHIAAQASPNQPKENQR